MQYLSALGNLEDNKYHADHLIFLSSFNIKYFLINNHLKISKMISKLNINSYK